MSSFVTECAYLIPHLHICFDYAPKDGLRSIFCEYSERVSRELRNSSSFLLKMLRTILESSKPDSEFLVVPEYNCVTFLFCLNLFLKGAFSKQWRKLQNEGVLTDDLMKHVWGDLKVLEYKPQLLKLMKAFDLLFDNPVIVSWYCRFFAGSWI